MPLGTLGLDSLQYRSNPNLSLIRDHPSPLSRYGMGRDLPRQKKVFHEHFPPSIYCHCLVQPYIVVPLLSNLVSPPISSEMGNVFRLPPRPPLSTYYPHAGYTYLQRVHSFAGPDYLQVGTSDRGKVCSFTGARVCVCVMIDCTRALWFVSVQMPVSARPNESFANNFLEEFIGRSIEDQLIPDILLEIIGELEQEVTHSREQRHPCAFLSLE